jgi:hypothetical protein
MLTAIVGTRLSGYEGVGIAAAVGIETMATAKARRRHERPSAQR